MATTTISPRTKAPELMLLETARRVALTPPGGGWAGHIRLSRLPTARLRDNFSFAVRTLRTAMEQFQGRLYVLSNSDVVLLSWQAKLHQLRPIADNVQALFEVATDPDSGPDEEFCTWYDL